MEEEAGALQESGVRAVSMGWDKRNEETGKLVKESFCDAYLFYLKYHGKDMGPEVWDAATRDLWETVRKHHGAAICGRLMLAALIQLNEEKDGSVPGSIPGPV